MLRNARHSKQAAIFRDAVTAWLAMRENFTRLCLVDCGNPEIPELARKIKHLEQRLRELHVRAWNAGNHLLIDVPNLHGDTVDRVASHLCTLESTSARHRFL